MLSQVNCETVTQVRGMADQVVLMVLDTFLKPETGMSTEDVMDYGPLTGLIGAWEGERGLDLAPEPDGDEATPYYETLVFEAAGEVTNAEEQTLAVLRYHQVVCRKENGEVFHDQVGYWMWDEGRNTVMQSLAIPRGVTVVASGTPASDGDNVVLSVDTQGSAGEIAQSAFMKEKARTTRFHHKIVLAGDTLSYEETTVLDIYGRTMDHTDANVLTRT